MDLKIFSHYKEDGRLMVFENRVLMIFWSNGDEIIMNSGKFHKEELHNMHTLANNIRRTVVEK
jgi:hypothetical protein